MTANELADKLDMVRIGLTLEAATMLRQQQAELDAFKLNYYNTGYSLQLRDKNETIKQQQAEIEALKLRELTDEEIESAYWSLVGKQHEGKIASYLYNFARDILTKASEK